jgi:hypothetical protein
VPGMTLAAASSFSSLSISAAAFVLGLGSTGCCSAHTRLIAQTGVTLAATSGSSSLSISAAAFVLGLGSTGCCSARTQLFALMDVTLAATSGFSSLSTSATALPSSWAAQVAARRARSCSP